MKYCDISKILKYCPALLDLRTWVHTLVRIYVCGNFLFNSVSIHVSSYFAHRTHACTNICVDTTHAYVLMHTYVHPFVRVRKNIHTYACMYVRMHVHIPVCVSAKSTIPTKKNHQIFAKVYALDFCNMTKIYVNKCSQRIFHSLQKDIAF